MRVTKVIREYVEREVRAKYSPLINEIGKEYYEKEREFQARIKDYEKVAVDAVNKIAEEFGFKHVSGFSSSIVNIYASRFCDPDEESRIRKERSNLESRCNKDIENILLNLELGETTKAELKDAIEAVSPM